MCICTVIRKYVTGGGGTINVPPLVSIGLSHFVVDKINWNLYPGLIALLGEVHTIMSIEQSLIRFSHDKTCYINSINPNRALLQPAYLIFKKKKKTKKLFEKGH